MKTKENIVRSIAQSGFDEEMYYLCYKRTSPHGRVYTRVACMIHIDDIEGMFGEGILEIAKATKPGGMDDLPW